jgi:hypothetical protein
MSLLIGIVIALIVVAIVFYLVTLIPMQQQLRTAIDVIILIILVLWILSVSGILNI